MFQWYWPPGIPRDATVDAFKQAFQRLGYQLCANGDAEDGIEKLAFFCGPNGHVTHGARQLEDGAWTSKLGGADDIRHASEHDLQGHEYGRVAFYMSRPRP